MNVRHNAARKFVVSFSGIDGSGKSTQIEALSSQLRKSGLHVQLIRFWDDIASLKRLREKTGHAIFKGDKGVGTPSAPINRRDKNVQSGLMTICRLMLYFADALSIRRALKKGLQSCADCVIFDRYTWDELANLNVRHPLIRGYISLVAAIVPRPHLSFVLDAEPQEARARKPEYPLEFLQSNRQAYVELANLLGDITVISPMPIPDVQREILAHTTRAVFCHFPRRKEFI